MSAVVLWTANDARVVAVAPSRRISGCAQWWPVRTQTPSRPRISPTSCGCAPSSANDTSAPRSEAFDRAVERRAPGTSASRASASATSACSCARICSIPISAIQSTADPKPDRLGDLRRAGLELPRQVGPRRLGVADHLDHVAAADERRHLARAAPAARAGRRSRSDRTPCGPSRRRSRRRSPAGRPAAAGPPASRRSPPPRRPRGRARVISATGLIVPSTFETWTTASSFGPRDEQPLERLEVELAVVEHRHVSELRPAVGTQQLPGDDVRVVLHLGQHHEVAGAARSGGPTCRRRG